MVTDTVGFIQKLPTKLISSFRATLEEVSVHACTRKLQLCGCILCQISYSHAHRWCGLVSWLLHLEYEHQDYFMCVFFRTKISSEHLHRNHRFGLCADCLRACVVSAGIRVAGHAFQCVQTGAEPDARLTWGILFTWRTLSRVVLGHQIPQICTPAHNQLFLLFLLISVPCCIGVYPCACRCVYICVCLSACLHFWSTQ